MCQGPNIVQWRGDEAVGVTSAWRAAAFAALLDVRLGIAVAETASTAKAVDKYEQDGAPPS